jgi:DNA-binding NtrC family response regulator
MRDAGLPAMLVVDDDELTRLFMRGIAQKLGLRALEAADGFEALEKVNASVKVALIDLQMPRMGGMELIPELRKRFPSIRFIVVSGAGNLDDAVAVMKLGACDYLQKPVDFSSLAESVARCCRPELPQPGLDSPAERKVGVSSGEAAQIISGSWRADLLRIAPLDATVLLTGETGTGKSMAAKLIHENSPRAGKPLVSVNCASLPRDLIECELFGHKKGSFTGAVEDRAGRAELADGGTLFLDEIGDLPLELQPKLLTFLQDRTAFRIGSNIAYKVDCRVVAATHRDLLSLCREKLFREDLFFRLDVLRVKLPPLRERKEEIRGIVESALQRLASRYGRPSIEASDEFLNGILSHSWPGNIRELENVLERAVAFAEGSVLTREDVRLSDYSAAALSDRSDGPAPADKSCENSLAGMTLDDVEKMAVEQKLRSVGGNKARAARELGISEKSIYNKMKRLGLDY